MKKVFVHGKIELKLSLLCQTVTQEEKKLAAFDAILEGHNKVFCHYFLFMKKGFFYQQRSFKNWFDIVKKSLFIEGLLYFYIVYRCN